MGFHSRDVRIVLVRPRNPLNIAAAARAMKNFGFEDLVLVAAYEPVWLDARGAPGAKDLLRNARVAPRLLDALDDRTLVLGTSSLARRRPLQPVFSLDQFRNLSKQRKSSERLAVLFGSEKTGLSNRDLSHCHAVLRIPTEEHAPTMNLGQAVAVCCYELTKVVRPGRGKQQKSSGENPASLATVGEVNRLVAEMNRLLGRNSEGDTGPAQARSLRLRDMLSRCPLKSRDVTLLLGVIRDLFWRLDQQA